MITIAHFEELQRQTAGKAKSYLLLWKNGSDQSRCAYNNLAEAASRHPSLLVMTADVSEVRDIHSHYAITTAPALLVFEEGTLKNVIKGCHDASFFTALFEEAVYQAAIRQDEKPSKRVTVYSTPTCSWCTTLKQWLRKNHVAYSEIDVSRDEEAARDLVRRSGQQGVPQTDINGEIVVGFDQGKLKRLLEI